MKKYTTVEKKNVVHIEIFKKNNKEIKISETFRSGFIITNENVDISNYKEEVGINVWDFDLDDHEFSDGVSNDIQFESSINKENQLLIKEIFYELGTEGLESNGWEHYDTEVWFYGKLNITNI